jgi:hypothetical protein
MIVEPILVGKRRTAILRALKRERIAEELETE